MKRVSTTTRVVAAFCCVLVLASLTAAPAAASEHAEEEFRVELDAEGNADVAVTYTYDLETDSERTAFNGLQGNETARERLATQFRNRMQSVAEKAGNTTGREMAVTDASVDVNSTDGTGAVTLTAKWEGLAAVDGNRLTVTEPFASGFEPNRTFTVAVPDGYEVTSATPEPSNSGDATASWAAGTTLEEFELVVEPAGDGTGDDGGDTDGSGAGFGIGVAAVALVGAALLARRRT